MNELPPITDFFDDEPIITPAAMHDGKKFNLNPSIKTAICTFLCENIDNGILEPVLRDCHLLYYVYGRSGKTPIYQYRNQCLIVFMTVGSPVAVAVMEELKYLGIKNVIAYGTAGQLDDNISNDACVLIEKAIRDEGASYHYLPASTYVATDKQLTTWLEQLLQSDGIPVVRGVTWTTDGMYRETNARCVKRREQGAVVVEMECAGFAAASERLKMRFAEFVFFSDTLTNVSQWHMLGAEKQSDARRSLKVDLLLTLLANVTKIKLPN
jgi:uridine phosphorylase